MSRDKRTSTLRPWLWLLAMVVVVLVASSVVVRQKLAHDPSVACLSPQQGAQWISYDEPASLGANQATVTACEFRTFVESEAVDAGAVLTIRAFRAAAVFWDGQLIHSPREHSTWHEWKTAQQVALPTVNQDKPHELRLQAFNDFGPPLVLAHCEDLGIQSGTSWEARLEGGEWSTAASVDDPSPPELSRQFPTVREAFVDSLPLLIGIIALVGAATGVFQWGGASLDRARALLSAGTLRWVLWGAWAVLAFNNHSKLVFDTGFDVSAHWEYTEYLIEHKRIPLANEGWQMFQSPLYYLLTAGLWSVLSLVFTVETSMSLTRFIPLFCGAIQIELCYRGLRYVFPNRNDLQCLGLMLGGLLPMNLYICQGFGNEPLQAVFSSAAVVLAFKFLREPQAASTPKLQYLLGLWLGLGMLTKLTPLLLIPPCCVLQMYLHHREGKPLSSGLVGCSRMLAACAAVAGWYYLRNWFYLGQPFVGGWDAARGIAWWQYPGYRTLSQFTSFGECLQYPVVVSYRSVWDGLYATLWLDSNISGADHRDLHQWNENLMLAGTWLALIPTAAMLLGAVSAFRLSTTVARDALLFSTACIGIFVSALLYMNLNVPFYSHTKATVTLGLIPCYAALGAAGFDLLTRHRTTRVVFYALVSAWAVFAYLAYFIVD